MKTANATLVIHNERAFVDDIWQYENEFTVEEWREVIEGFASIVSEAREVLEEMETENFMDDKLYQLGDVANFFNSIAIKKGR